FSYLKNPAKTDEQVFITLDHNDELGKMAQTINQHVASVQERLNQDRLLIQEATQTVNHLKEGKFGQRLSLSSNYHELNALKDVMNEMMDSLEQKIQAEIKQRSDQEKLLVQQSKLAAMGNMLGNIAHQWRQPISEINAILMEVEAIARYDTLSQEKLLTYIHTCCDVTEHMSNTIYDFQNFFQPSKNKESFSVMEACNNAISIINASLKYHNITLSYDYAAKDSLIIGYPNEFAHAVLNILSNAKDVLIERRVLEPSIRINIKTGKHFTIIRIEDNGGGIAAENIDRIFEPYFTTKHAKQGTGIGLYMTKAIIENNMQGYVNVENTDQGALFSIKLHLPL
ncbi:MAG: GHKL domain-containing protein, partial [Epsilonproteobacteria bacterium]|nr:GHKL domain-containing protein [Campylobacterota bacterium]